MVAVKLSSPAAERNRDAIADVLARFLPSQGVVLEIASGSGEHAIHFAKRFPSLQWQPTDRDSDAIASIADYRTEAGLQNLLPPLELDVTQVPWPVAHADAIVCINMIHISPIAAMRQLFAGAAGVVPGGRAPLPLRTVQVRRHVHRAVEQAFDQSLRSRNPSWGVRDLGEITATATRTGFGLAETIAMPANNHSLIFKRLIPVQ